MINRNDVAPSSFPASHYDGWFEVPLETAPGPVPFVSGTGSRRVVGFESLLRRHSNDAGAGNIINP